MTATVRDGERSPKRRFALPRNALVVGGIALLVALAGVWWLVLPRSSESTDNAYLRADSTTVAARVGGQVTAVLVRDNQPVRAGQPLIRLDIQDYEARVAAAQAAVADADAGVAEADAALAGLAADERLALARVRSASTGISSADAEYARAAADRNRYEALAAQGFATRRDAERIGAAAVGAAAGAERSRADLGVSTQETSVARARRPVLAARLQAARAEALKARAALVLARQDRDRAVIVAPVSGTVGNRQAQVGDVVQPGSRLLTIVPTEALYVIANFKETQTREMRIGQPVTIDVDALRGDPLHGVVESFAPGSGSEFTLLPFEPGSGNFTKIVQRIAVRIRLDRDATNAAANLRPGLSVTAKVSLH